MLATKADESDTLDTLLEELATEVHKNGNRLGKVPSIGRKIAALKNPAAIPTLIGIIDSDNSYKTIYGVGYFSLGNLTGVKHDEVHHGRWWKKWWAKNKQRFPKEVQDIPIPTYPLTKQGKEFAANPPDPDSIILEPTADDLLARIKSAIETGNYRAMVTPCERLAELGDQRVIPKLIGLMDSDNSAFVVRQLGGGPLAELTGVFFHPSRHGKWWREWWKKNKSSLPESLQKIAIPEYPQTEHGEQFAKQIKGQPIILDPTLDDLLKLITAELAAGTDVELTAEWIATYANPRAIEPLIKLIAQDKTGKLKQSIGPELKLLADADAPGYPDGLWWTNWWEEHKVEINRRIARTDEPASGNLYVPNHRRKLLDGDDVKDIPGADTLIDGDERKRYVLLGPKKGSERPPRGWKLFLILAGGDGSPDFHPFVKRIYKHVVPQGYLAVHVIAPEWNRRQAQKLVWPTTLNPCRGMMEFSTEQLVDAVIDDVGDKHEIDKRFIFTLSWSSSGPAAYAISLSQNTQVTGSFVAMSIFRPKQLPPLKNAKDHRFFILHSPQDFIPINQAKEAERLLQENGADVKFMSYKGGHGWRDDPFGRMRTGIEWLEGRVLKD
jgi:predicted esterase